jgi:hypothetical protein
MDSNNFNLRIPGVPQPPYSPYFYSVGFLLSLKWKLQIKNDMNWKSIQEI